MKRFAFLVLIAASIVTIGGCAVGVGPGIGYSGYGYNGAYNYYWDAGLGVYFYYDGYGVRHFTQPGWAPPTNGWRNDGSWGRGGGMGWGNDWPGRW